MAVLIDGDRQNLHKEIMQDLSLRRDSLALNKADLRAAIDAIDQWVDDNAVAFNTSIPLAARNALSANQKLELLTVVIRRRWEVS